MNIDIKNELFDKIIHYYLKYMNNTKFEYKGRKLSVRDLLQMVLYTYEKQRLLNDSISPYDVMCDFPNMGYYRKVGCPESTNYHITTLMQIMLNNNLVEKGKHFSILPNKGVNHIEVIINKNSTNLSNITPTDIAFLLFLLPDDLVDYLIKDYLPNGKNSIRVSNNWDNNGLLINDRWVVEFLNNETEKYTEFKLIDKVRTPKENIKIINDLVDCLYIDNTNAKTQLNYLKHQLRGNIHDDD